MLTSPTTNSLPNNKPRYAQINLCSSLLQETRDTRIHRKPIQVSHNHEDQGHPSKQSTPSYKLVCKNTTVVKIEHNFVRTEGPSSVPKSKSSNTQNSPNYCRAQMPTLDQQSCKINIINAVFTAAVRHHCWED